MHLINIALVYNSVLGPMFTLNESVLHVNNFNKRKRALEIMIPHRIKRGEKAIDYFYNEFRHH